MIRPIETWTLRRLVAGLPVNGEMEALSGPFRRLGERLDVLPLDERQAAWNAFADARDDAASLNQAMADVDPHGPAPNVDSVDAADDWPPLRWAGLPPVDRFPIEVLPEPAARLVVEGADAIGCPPDFLGAAVLALAGGTIGRSVSLRLKANYFASAILFIALVGPPSDGKTPALKSVSCAVRRIDDILAAKHAQAIERWEAEKAAAAKGSRPTRPPKSERIDVDDITMEVIPLILADNPRGLVMIRDELSALLLGMNQYKGGKGNDRAVILKIWAGEAIKKDRVGHEAQIPIRCPHPFLSIVGGIPPDLLGALTDPKGNSDGFVDRFLFAYPDSLPVADWTEEGIFEETTEGWCELVACLWARPLNVVDGRSVPHVIRFTPEGRAAWMAHYKALAAEMNRRDFAPGLRGPWGKFREYAGRFVLILACLDHAADPAADPASVPNVGPLIVHNAWRLVDYFKSHARRAHAAMAHGPGIGGGPMVKVIVEWIRDGARAVFSERDITQARRNLDSDDLTEALTYLVGRNAIRSVENASATPKPGRRPTPCYEVNPALLNSQNTQNAQNLPPVTPSDSGIEGFEYFEK